MQQTEKQQNIFNISLNILLKTICKLAVFSFQLFFYFIDLTLLLISDLIENYLVADFFLFKEQQEEQDDNYKIEILDNTIKHEYRIKRSSEFTNIYNDLKSNIDITKKADLVLDLDLSNDIISKVDRLIFLADKEGLENGYKFARTVRDADMEQDDIYRNYLITEILQGKGM